ncbi:H-2 class II histocompatibility antigen, A-Q alpha chain-like [Boleophthalmus pectinirostris]|uniref:H-2 class II histocompatibility antigen, A-Q alpha chain-like n=1 Tax=Boleophthalmus pectinirostris TaxID=150288 RepID=UPI000A1C75E9|nr:H-2 class II histocompatibility antigen, A-Q alpha chain-like [Boleophthalmus pectinirostris]
MSAFSCAVLVLFCTFASVHGIHQLCHNVACFDTGATQLTLTADGDRILYVDFNNKSIVWNARVPSYYHSVYSFNYTINFQFQCKFHLNTWKQDSTISKIPAAPEVLIYPKEDVKNQINNTLICFVRNFFPPIIKIQWTKNEEVIASDDPFEKMIPGSDGTFQVFSMLSFVPAHGDIYSCSVRHQTLKEPVVRFFEFHSSGTDIGPMVYCAICTSLGIAAFISGTFLFLKDSRRQNA